MRDKEARSGKGISRQRKWMQAFFVLAAILLGLRHIMPGKSSAGGALDSFCPFGGIETLGRYLIDGGTLKTTSLLNFTVLLSVLGLSFLAGRAFCGWVCPLGTLQDIFAALARRLSGERRKIPGKKSRARFPRNLPKNVDRWARYLKYLVLGLIGWLSISAVYPPLRDICPVRSFFAFHWNTPLLGFVLLGFVLSSMLVERFSCRYLCPLGATLAIFNKVSPLSVKVDAGTCTFCGRCDADCPMEIQDVPENTRSLECVRCLACMETCARSGAIELWLGKPAEK